MTSVALPLLASRAEHSWSSSELFRGFSEHDFTCVRRCLGASVTRFDRGQEIFPVEDSAPLIGVLLTGTVIDISVDENGEGSVVDIVRAGGTLGEGWPTAAAADRSFESVTSGTAVILHAARLIDSDSRCEVRPRIVENLLRSTLRRSARLRAHLDLVARKSLRDRVLGYLDTERATTGSSSFRIPLQRAELASYLHADRAALSRELSRMRRDGVVDFQRSDFIYRGAASPGHHDAFATAG